MISVIYSNHDFSSNYLRLATDQWFFLGTPVSSTNKTDHHDITEILLKVALNNITLIPNHPITYYLTTAENCFYIENHLQ
jgi:hypothetical protein